MKSCAVSQTRSTNSGGTCRKPQTRFLIPLAQPALRIADGRAAVSARRVPIDRQDKEQWGVRSGFQDFLSLRIVCQHLPDEIVEASQWCRQATNVLFLLFSQQPSSFSFPACRV